MSSFASSEMDTGAGGKDMKPKKEKKEKVSAKERRALKEKAKEQKEAGTKVDVSLQDLSLLQAGGEKLTEEQLRVATFRSVTGVLASAPEMRDVKFDSFSLMVGGNQLVTDCHVEVHE